MFTVDTVSNLSCGYFKLIKSLRKDQAGTRVLPRNGEPQDADGDRKG